MGFPGFPWLHPIECVQRLEKVKFVHSEARICTGNLMSQWLRGSYYGDMTRVGQSLGLTRPLSLEWGLLLDSYIFCFVYLDWDFVEFWLNLYDTVSSEESKRVSFLVHGNPLKTGNVEKGGPQLPNPGKRLLDPCLKLPVHHQILLLTHLPSFIHLKSP